MGAGGRWHKKWAIEVNICLVFLFYMFISFFLPLHFWSSFYSGMWLVIPLVLVLQLWMESRDEVVPRLRAAVRWVNENCSEQLWKFCTNQKEHAEEVLLRDGGRTTL